MLTVINRYEDVWMALSKALKSPVSNDDQTPIAQTFDLKDLIWDNYFQIHVDSYKMRLYQALRGDAIGTKEHPGPFISHEGPTLSGYTCANSAQSGCLTLDQNVRLHSCEKGMSCQGVDGKTVWIRPIITRTSSGTEIGEIGVGGGAGDLRQCPELELGTYNDVKQLMEM